MSGAVELEAELRAGLADFYMAGQWSVVSDHPALAIACGGYRVVQTANQNNFRHFGPSERWIGIESYGAANHIARCSPDNILTILDTIATLRSERDTLLAQVEKMRGALEKIKALLPNPTLPITHAIKDIASAGLDAALTKEPS